jgi:hypothetical protein
MLARRRRFLVSILDLLLVVSSFGADDIFGRGYCELEFDASQLIEKFRVLANLLVEHVAVDDGLDLIVERSESVDVVWKNLGQNLILRDHFFQNVDLDHVEEQVVEDQRQLD